jgi:hypothetical protein
MKAVLYEDFRDKIELDTPLTSNADIMKLRTELGIPQYVAAEDYLMRRLVVTVWAARNVNLICEQLSGDAKKRVPRSPVDVAFFGGAAFRLLCKGSNQSGAFHRALNDLDIITAKERATDLINLMSVLGQVFGTEYFHFVTTADRLFNNAMRPKRYRIHAVNGLHDGIPAAGEMDIFCDRIAMCHTVDVGKELKNAPTNLYTIGLEKLLLTKLQFIKKIPKEVIDPSNEYRIIGDFDGKNVLVGMEDKDFRDVASVFHDYDLGEDDGEIRINELYDILKKDLNMCKTVHLNLLGILKNTHRLNLPREHASIIEDKIRKLIKELPEAREGFLGAFKKQWWATVEG